MKGTNKDLKPMFAPQEGPQTTFMNTDADIIFYGGAAGGGKTYAILLECLRYINRIKNFGGVIFRRTIPQIKAEGGIFDESMKIFPFFGAKPNMSELYWRFPKGATISFSHLEHEKNVLDWQGSQIAFIGFEELTHFTKRQFFYMMSRNRSNCGVIPYIRATMNPEKNSWIRAFIDWWIFPKGHPLAGTADPSRSGVVRYFIIEDDVVIWKDRREEFDDPTQAKSFTFIAASIMDNKILMEKNPEYLANLKALPRVEREKLLGGNWDAEESPGDYFKKENFRILKERPRNIKRVIRYWDRAASESDTADWTVGLLLAELDTKVWVIMDIVRFRATPGKVLEKVKNITAQDQAEFGWKYWVGIEEDPGQAGKAEAEYFVSQLAGYVIKLNKVTQKKEVRATPVSSQTDVGNIYVVEGKWNDEFFTEAGSFPLGVHDDQVDALSGAFQVLTGGEKVGKFTDEMADLEPSGFSIQDAKW